jgi:predicted ribosome quality control (RQC) complex YloA/Tae2 family protein
MSPTICTALLAQPERAIDLYGLIVSLPAPAPVRCGDVVFPLPLCEGDRVASLILPVAAASAAAAEPADRTSRAIARMRRELERAREAPRLRAVADALMALGTDAEVPAVVTLSDGTQTAVPRADDQRDTPITLAERLYKDVRAMERALEQLPARITALEEKPESLPVSHRPKKTRTTSATPRAGSPYKSYRTSGGIEVLVGRGARANDELTYDIAKPDDVWLHARDVTGAHVVMRWAQEGAPPARDLHEAAALAAWYSRARGSVVVPVDWTRRRHVRRARGGPPGRALVERAQTVMARPSAELERKLRANDE